MSKSTCNKCLMWELFDEKCPNYFKNTFYPMGKVEEAYIVEDCAPIRTMLMIKELHSLLIGTQKSFEQQRNEMGKFLSPVNDLMSLIQMSIESKKNDTILLPEERR